jgi:hypothetical protein
MLALLPAWRELSQFSEEDGWIGGTVAVGASFSGEFASFLDDGLLGGSVEDQVVCHTPDFPLRAA